MKVVEEFLSESSNTITLKNIGDYRISYKMTHEEDRLWLEILISMPWTDKWKHPLVMLTILHNKIDPYPEILKESRDRIFPPRKFDWQREDRMTLEFDENKLDDIMNIAVLKAISHPDAEKVKEHSDTLWDMFSVSFTRTEYSREW